MSPKNLLFLWIFATAFSVSFGHRVKRIVGGRKAAPPPPDDPVVFAHMYNRDARVEGYRNQITGIYSFLGLRYAEAPVGPNRFARPRYKRLEGDVSATKFGPPCPQPDPYNPNSVVGNEDCLLMNIMTPRMPDGEGAGLPVYIWIHPGGFRYGSAAQYDAETFAQEGVIVVPVQYRLGTLGIIGDNTKEFNGNLAMYDMTAALRWVTEYISFFGGDPKQVKVMGQGSGAASAMYMSMSRLPRSGSISGVVSMSGSALAQYAKDEEPVQSMEEIAAINNCPNNNETAIVSCMRGRSAEEIVLSDSNVQTERLQGRAMVKGLSGGVGFNPHQEGPDDQRGLPGFLTEEPGDQIKENRTPEIPLLIGVTKEETGNAPTLKVVEKVFGTAEKFLNSLLDTAIVGDLKKLLNVDQVSGKLLKPVLPGLGKLNLGLDDLLKIPANLNAFDLIKKLAETTTDVLFNLPAVLSAENWGKKAPAFLYSFEHRGKVSNGYNFLRGLPVVTEQKNDNFTSHGDDLGYIFKCNDIFGNPIKGAELESEEDKKVQKNMIGLLTRFAKISNAEDVEKDGFLPSFGSKQGVPYIKITEKLEILENFRFCELSLWGAPLEAIKSTTCEGLGNALSTVTGTLGQVTGGLTGGLTGTLGLGGNKNQKSGNSGFLGLG